MSVSSNPDVYAAARSEHAAIGSARHCSGDGVFVADDQPLRVATGVVAAVLARRGLVAQAELKAAIAGLEAGVAQRAVQLGRVLPQHRPRARFLARHMGRSLAFASDIDA